MNTKKITKISILALSMLIILALTAAMIFIPNSDRHSNGNINSVATAVGGSIASSDGDILSKNQADAMQTAMTEFGIDQTQFAWITSQEELKEFITGTQKVGYLANDVDYDTNTLGWVTSNTIFDSDRALDGNGHKINIVGKNGIANWVQYKNYASVFPAGVNKNIRATGMLVGINKGIIRNANIIYTSNLLGGLNPDSFKDGNKISDQANEDFIDSIGIITGVNEGAIRNCSIQVDSVFAYKNNVGGAAEYARNAAYVGGFAGMNVLFGVISKVTIENNSHIGAISMGGSNYSCLTAVGGIAGAVSTGGAKIEYVTTLGNGFITSFGYDGNVSASSTAGGAVLGTSAVMTGNSTLTVTPLNAGQVFAIISNFKGSVINQLSRGVASKTVKGGMFGNIGKLELGETGCEYLLFLFDYKGENNNSVYADTETQNVIFWTQATALDDIKGKITARFNYDSAQYPVQVLAIAKGTTTKQDVTTIVDGQEVVTPNVDVDQNESLVKSETITSANKFYHVDNNYVGGIIWKCQFNDNAMPHVDIKSEIIKAETYSVIKTKGTTTENYVALHFTFGEAAKLNYGNNFQKTYDNLGLNKPTPTLQSAINTPALPSVNQNIFKYNISVKFEDDATNYAISTGSGNSIVENFGNTFYPGTYSMKATCKYETKDLAYYDLANYIFVLPESSESYKAIITKSVLTVTGGNAGWVQQSNFNISLENRVDAFDKLVVTAGSEFSSFDTNGVANYQYSSSEQTGQNGKNYVFGAYKSFTYNVLEGEVVVGKSKDVLVANKVTISNVKIDTTAPEITNIRYWDYSNETKGQELFAADLQTWRTTKIMVTYFVSDDSRSGLKPKDFDNQYTEEVIENFGGVAQKFSCSMVLSNNQPVILAYNDFAENAATTTISCNIDIVPISYKVTKPNGIKSADGTKYIDVVTLSITPIFGGAGATMYYSYEQDDQNQDIWLKWDKELSSNSVNKFYINWEMTNAPFKTKIVSNAGLYEDYYYLGDGILSSALAGNINWTVELKVATINIHLDNIMYIGNGGITMSLANFSKIDMYQMFKKSYDGTTTLPATCTQEQFYITIYDLFGNLVVANSIIPVVEGAVIDASAVNVGINIQFETSNSGEVNVVFTPILNEDDSRIYYVKFVDEGITYDNLKIASQIEKRVIYFDMDTHSSIKRVYTYGQDILSGFQMDGINGEVLEFDYVTTATNRSPVTGYFGGHELSCSPKENYSNYEINITNTILTIVPKQVVADKQLDGMQLQENVIEYDGIARDFVSRYVDIDGVTQLATVEMFLDENCTIANSVNFVKAIGKYFIKISISGVDANTAPNYIISDTINGYEVFELEVVKVQIKMTTGFFMTDYEARDINYVYTKDVNPQANINDLYNDNDFVVKYYRYNSFELLKDESKNIIGVTGIYSSTNQGLPSEIGAYHVVVEFKGNNYFNAITKTGSMLITKAETVISADNLQYVWDSSARTFDMVQARVAMNGLNTGLNIVNFIGESPLNTNNIQLQVWDFVSKQYINANSENAFFANVKVDELGNETPYKFKLVFDGNENYLASGLEVEMLIKKAEFEKIVFAGSSLVYDGASHRLLANTSAYPGVSIKYSYLATTQTAPFEFTNAGEYTIFVTYSMENFNDFRTSAVLNIKKAELKGISTVPVIDQTYDGKPHSATISGLTPDGKGGYTYKGQKAVVTAINATQTNSTVTKEEVQENPIAGKVCEFLITVANYETLRLSSFVQILPKEVSLSFLKDKVTTEDIMSGKIASYTNEDGETIECQARYINVDTGEEVLWDGNGRLPAGNYIAEIIFDSLNYTSTQAFQFNVVDPKTTNMGLIVGIVVGVVAVFGLMAVAIIIAKKKKS